LSLDLQKYLEARKTLINDALNQYLPDENQYPEKIHQAVRYSVFGGGKRLRPILLLAGYEVFRDDFARALPFAAAIEMLHTYSLIHDDLPAMDNDDLRRGKPTSHKLFGESIAILAGDALQAEAFALMAQAGSESGFTAQIVLRAIWDLASAAGLSGMVSGQAMDMETQGKPYAEKDLEFIHLHKSAALIRASVVIGGRLGGAEKNFLNALSGFGEKIGLAFQVMDDILDLKGGENFGKTPGSDKILKKATYVNLFGLKKSEQKARSLIDQAAEFIKGFSDRAEPLRKIAAWIVDREF